MTLTTYAGLFRTQDGAEASDSHIDQPTDNRTPIFSTPIDHLLEPLLPTSYSRNLITTLKLVFNLVFLKDKTVRVTGRGGP
jgi:hypothetical protein